MSGEWFLPSSRVALKSVCNPHHFFVFTASSSSRWCLLLLFLNPPENHRLAHISKSFWATQHNIGVSLCTLAQSSNATLLAACSEDCQSDEWDNTLSGCAEQQGHTMLKKETYIPSLTLLDREMEEKMFLFLTLSLTFFSIGYFKKNEKRPAFDLHSRECRCTLFLPKTSTKQTEAFWTYISGKPFPDSDHENSNPCLL